MKKRRYFLVFMAFLLGSFQSCRHEPIVPFDDTSGNGSGACSPDSAYFNRDVMPIIQLNCSVTGCHGGGSAANGVDLTSYQSIMNSADVDPFNPANSILYEVITATDPNKIMPVPPSAPLSNTEIAIIAKWINQGAQNNLCSECDDTLFTFSDVVNPIIQDNCVGCHSGSNPSAGILLTTYDEILAYANSGALFGSIDHEASYVEMPYLAPKLSNCDVNQVRLWVDNGALND